MISPAFFISFLWVLFRRMYLVTGLYFVFLIVSPNLTEVSRPLFLFVLVLQLIIPAIFADSVYWWHANRMIRRAEQKFADPGDQITWLRKRGGTSSFWVMLLSVAPVIYMMIETVVRKSFN